MQESRQIGSGQIGDGKSEHQHSRNQQTKMDWNGSHIPLVNLFKRSMSIFAIMNLVFFACGKT